MHVKAIASNMTELHLSTGVVVLFSYETPVAAFIPGAGYVRTEQHYSMTTSRHINKWLGSRINDAKKGPQNELSELVERAA